MNIITNSVIEPLPSDVMMEENEKKWHVKLPSAYKNFLKKYNGGIPKENHFYFEEEEYEIVRFLGMVQNINVSDLGWYDIGVVESEIGERLTSNMDLIGMEVVPIAELSHGDYACLDLREGTDFASVCVWFCDESDEFEPVTKKIANDFEEFLSMIK